MSRRSWRCSRRLNDLSIAAIALRSGNFSDEVLREAGAIALYDDVAALLAGYGSSLLAK